MPKELVEATTWGADAANVIAVDAVRGAAK
jgi:hypothetical protein